MFLAGPTSLKTKRRRVLTLHRLKQLVKLGLLLGFLAIMGVLACNFWVVRSTEGQVYFSLRSLPSNDVALVLGTSKFVRSGKENLFFRYRMEAAARLWKEGKVKYLILSGNSEEFYNEPSDMRRALLRLGVPTEVMTLDPAGYRTFDSIVRCKNVYGHRRITIISQNFHTARALYIANHEGLNAIGFAAQDVPDGYSLRTLIREYLARPLAMLDVHVLRRPVRESRR